MDGAETRRIEPVAHGDSEAQVEAFAGLDRENFAGSFCIGPGGCGVHLLARVVEHDVIDERSLQVDAGI